MMIVALRKVIKRMHYPLEVTLTCVRAGPGPVVGHNGHHRAGEPAIDRVQSRQCGAQ